MDSNDKPATKDDVEEIVERIVTKSVGSATTQILTAVGDQLQVMNDDIDKRFDKVDGRFDRLELKVDNVTDNHGVRITKLEKQQV